MRKLVIFCFAVCMTVLSVLSLFNFAQDAEESMILDKRAVILEKPETLSNREFLGQIDTALGKIGADIMYRYAELDGDKPLYRYYKTSHTDSFLSVSTGKGSVRLESDEFFSTAKQLGAMALHLSSLFQDTAIYPLMQAQQHDLTAATWYVAEGQLDAVLHALTAALFPVHSCLYALRQYRILHPVRRQEKCAEKNGGLYHGEYPAGGDQSLCPCFVSLLSADFCRRHDLRRVASSGGDLAIWAVPAGGLSVAARSSDTGHPALPVVPLRAARSM